MAIALSSEAAVRVDDLVTRACERAGLDDFGGDSWREGLQLLVDTCESAPGVNPGGREFVYGQFVAMLRNRLSWTTANGTLVADEQVQRPLVILGLPRTGALGELSADQDSLRRSLLTWKPRIRAAFNAGNPVHRSAVPEEESRT
jgi:hypothetical protein